MQIFRDPTDNNFHLEEIETSFNRLGEFELSNRHLRVSQVYKVLNVLNVKTYSLECSNDMSGFTFTFRLSFTFFKFNFPHSLTGSGENYFTDNKLGQYLREHRFQKNKKTIYCTIRTQWQCSY